MVEQNENKYSYFRPGQRIFARFPYADGTKGDKSRYYLIGFVDYFRHKIWIYDVTSVKSKENLDKKLQLPGNILFPEGRLIPFDRDVIVKCDSFRPVRLSESEIRVTITEGARRVSRPTMEAIYGRTAYGISEGLWDPLFPDEWTPPTVSKYLEPEVEPEEDIEF